MRQGIGHVIEICVASGAGNIVSGVADIVERQVRTVEGVGETHVGLTAAVVGRFGEDISLRLIGGIDEGVVALERRESPIRIENETVVRCAGLDELSGGEAGARRGTGAELRSPR